MTTFFGELENFPGYLICRNGVIVSIKKEIAIQRSPHIGTHKYLSVGLLDKNKKKCTKLVHRLVAEVFLDNYALNLQVNHIDFDRLNNNVSNLEMVTMEDNLKHSRDNGRYCEPKDSNFAKLSLEEVILIKDMLEKQVCQRRIALVFNVHYSTISAIKCKKSWSSYD